MKKSRFLLLCIVLMMVSCTSKNEREAQLNGKWNMYKIFELEKDVTSEHNPNNNRWITFHEDGTFESDGDPYGYNTGKWTLDTEKAILFIDSDSEDDDSEWNISFKDAQLIWTGIGAPRKEGFTLIYLKEDTEGIGMIKKVWN